MKYTLAIAALLSESAAISTNKQGIEYNTSRPYGPYFTETTDFPRAFGRPSDASLQHDGYGDSAGVSTGTLSQLRHQGIEFNTDRPYGPYFKETNDFPRAFGRPSDASLQHDGYGDSAGVSTGTLSQLKNQGIEYTARPYGPYFKETNDFPRAFGRPSDASLQHDGYGDSAGVSTGTLSQMRSREEPKEIKHTDRPYGPYFDDKVRDGASVKLGSEDGRDENMAYGPYQVEGHKCKVGKNGSCIIPGAPRPEDRVVTFPMYKDVGGE